MNLTELNGEQLTARKAELITELDTPETRDALSVEDLEARKAEIEAIDAEIKSREQAEKEAAEERQAVAEGNDPVVKEFNVEVKKMNYELNSPEYREAWLKELQGKELSTEERAAVVAAAHVIPIITMNEIISKLELNPLIGAVDLMQIPGYVKLPKENACNEASWVAMSSASTDSADTMASIQLGAYKLIKTLEIDADVEAMSIDAFEGWLVSRLVNKIEKALDSAILNGGGSASSQAEGIKTTKSTNDGTFTRAGMTWAQLTGIMAKLAGEYHANASFVMRPALFFSKILGMVDSNGQRVVVLDPQGNRKYNILGYPCILDANAGTDDVFFGDFKAYKLNLAKGVEVAKSGEAEFRKGSAVYRAMTLADGKLADTNAVVWCVATT